MEETLITIPYVIVHIPDVVEVALVERSLSNRYYTKRINESLFSLKIAGGTAVEELETAVSKVTNLPCHAIEYGTLYLQTCKRRTLSGDISEHLHAYFPADDYVEIFSIIGEDVSYLGKGMLEEDDVVVLNYKWR